MEAAVFVSVLSLVVAAISASSAIFSAKASTRSARASEAALALNRDALAANREGSARSAELTKKMFLRQGVIDLHMAWQGVSDLNPNEPVMPDVVRAVGSLSLTASLWNHEVVDKVILYQNYWVMYDTLFRRLDGWEKPIPHLRVPGKNLLSREVRKAYKEMGEYDLSKVDQSKL